MKQYFIYVCCGAGKLTSYMAEEGLRDGLKKLGWNLKKDVKTRHGLITDVPKYEKDIDILVCSTTYTRTHKFPVVNGVGFVVQDDAMMQEAINTVDRLLKEFRERDGE